MEHLDERFVEGLRFVLTCVACPEQYDVYDGEEQVGYVRLRSGKLRVDVPDCGGDTVLVNGDQTVGDGDFETEELRDIWLMRAALAILGRRLAH